MSASRTAGVPVVVPSIILAETLHGDQRDARANQVLKNLVVLATTEPMARVAAILKRQSGIRGVRATIDALVVATSVFLGGGAILHLRSEGYRSPGDGIPGTPDQGDCGLTEVGPTPWAMIVSLATIPHEFRGTLPRVSELA